mmetsp:Transcript_17473/g.32719  ORF Transcript_17473/g.32719 Transcript_17473/m.32719 type:complete len:181 (+) Transcript_17473:613-1155(+)
MVVSFKRFTHDHQKNQRPIKVNKTLSLCMNSISSPLYQLVATINHVGGDLDSGHYIAVCQRPSDPSNPDSQPAWFLFNDSSVTELASESEIVDFLQNAYMAFYHTRETVETPVYPAEDISENDSSVANASQRLDLLSLNNATNKVDRGQKTGLTPAKTQNARARKMPTATPSTAPHKGRM